MVCESVASWPLPTLRATRLRGCSGARGAGEGARDIDEVEGEDVEGGVESLLAAEDVVTSTMQRELETICVTTLMSMTSASLPIAKRKRRIGNTSFV